MLLRNAIERSKEYSKNINYPVPCIQQIFRRLDRNHRGQVDSVELQNLAALLGFEADTKMLSALFARYDVDRAGSLGMDELGRAIFKPDGDSETKARSALARVREVLSVSTGGFETLKALSDQLRLLDRDRSGQLIREE